MKISPKSRYERNHKDSLITRSVANAINTTNMLFLLIESPAFQLIDECVNKFPIETAGNMPSIDKMIMLMINLSLIG
jgi:hypothetical protein